MAYFSMSNTYNAICSYLAACRIKFFAHPADPAKYTVVKCWSTRKNFTQRRNEKKTRRKEIFAS